MAGRADLRYGTGRAKADGAGANPGGGRRTVGAEMRPVCRCDIPFADVRRIGADAREATGLSSPAPSGLLFCRPYLQNDIVRAYTNKGQVKCHHLPI